MQTIIYSGSDIDIAAAAEIIKAGGLVAFPTETVYGLGANALMGEAAKRIYAAKGRPSDNPLIIHLASIGDAEKYCETNPLFYKIAIRFMPGPITVILPKRALIPPEVTGGLNTVAVRIPSNVTARRLIEKSGVPIAAPSANLSSSPSPTTLKHVKDDLDGRIDAIIDGGACEIGLESTIVKITDGGLMLLRPGAVTAEELGTLGEKVEIDACVYKKFEGTPLAPGMKYRHYAPRVPVVMLKGDDSAVYAFLSGRKNVGIVCFDGDIPVLGGRHTVSIGAADDKNRQAHEVFYALRLLDRDTEIDEIYVRMPRTDGIGLAVYNRLIKAAGYNCIEV